MKDFDEDYARRVREGCFKAILDAAVIDEKLQLREYEIYDGVISAIAMIHASQDKTPTSEITALVSEALAQHFREKVEALIAAKAHLGLPPAETDNSANVH
jgi:hypothetical protein